MDAFKTAIAESLEKPASKLAKERGLNALRIDVRGTASAPVIEVHLDGARLVTIEDCETVSKELNSAIEEEKLVKGNYRLDVMSPGMDEPLVHDYQFERSIGHLVEVQYEEHGEHHSLHGHLRDFSDADISIEPIHVKTSNPPRPRTVTTDEGPVTIEPDEQFYDKPVTLVKVERKHIMKVVVQPEFGR